MGCPSVGNVHGDNQVLPEYLIVGTRYLMVGMKGVCILKPQSYIDTTVFLCPRGLKVSGQKKYYRVTSFTKILPILRAVGFLFTQSS